MKNIYTNFLKVAILLLAFPVIALSIFIFPGIVEEFNDFYLNLGLLKYIVLIGMYASALTYFFALYHGFKILNYIDNDQAFSELSVNSLKIIRNCAWVITFLFVCAQPFAYLVAEKDDAPGLIIVGWFILFAPAIIAVFASVLQKLFKEAFYIKSENDLTV